MFKFWTNFKNFFKKKAEKAVTVEDIPSDEDEELVVANRKLRRAVKSVAGIKLPYMITRKERKVWLSIIRRK